MRVEPLTPDHLVRLEVQPHQRVWRDNFASLDLACLTDGGNRGWAALDGERPVAAIGIIDMGGGRAAAWGLLSEAAGPVFVGLHRAVEARMRLLPYRRIEAVTACDFQPARRWAAMLGFSCEGRMKSYCHDGSDAELWARVTHG